MAHIILENGAPSFPVIQILSVITLLIYNYFYAPAIFNGGWGGGRGWGHIVSPLSVRTYVPSRT